MTDKVETKDENTPVDKGLPELDANKKNKKGKKPPFTFILFVIVILGGAGFGVQYAIDSFGLFNKEEVIVEEPPVPDLDDTVTISDVDEDFIVGGVENTEEQIPNESDLGEPSGDSEQSKPVDHSEVLSAISLMAVDVSKISNVLELQQKEIGTLLNNQMMLAKALSEEVDARSASDRQIKTSLRENERWLNGIANQLENIGVEVKAASQEFPIVVYSRDVWGDDVYLTIAQKVNPEQTSPLRVGGIVGRWRLVEITSTKAVFEHFEGNVKEVML